MEDKKVDEAWKQKVSTEKETASVKESGKGKTSQPDSEEGGAENMGGLPEISFINFISGLATQTLMAMGQVQHPVTKKAEIDLEQAKYLIDTIEMLKQKTQGNLAPEEAKGVETLLYNLKMAYVRVSKGK